MKQSVVQQQTWLASLQRWLASLMDTLFFSLSDKLKFSIKASLSMVLAYLIPLSQGWAQASTAAITVMFIAAVGSVGESVFKGAMRVVGTIIGAIIGMTLIAVFPQERLLYLIALSIIVMIPLYLVRAFKGDASVFMLTGMTMMLVFKNGEVDDVFIYGIDKTYMTIFGIMVYTMIGVFIWPVNIEDDSRQSALNLSKAQAQLFLDRDASKELSDASLTALLKHEEMLAKSTVNSSTETITMQQWHSIKHNYSTITAHLTLLSMHIDKTHIQRLDSCIPNHKTLESEITQLFSMIALAWENEEKISIPQAFTIEYNIPKLKTLDHLARASLIATVREMRKLHEDLCRLARKLNRIHSAVPTYFESEKIPDNSLFLWGDREHLKGVLITFCIFWTATYFWITINPPGGFMIVALATGLSVLTTFTPIKPSLLIIVFSFSFIFATLMYVLVLPNLHYGWELGVFIFVYSFIAFHLLNPKMSIFFLLGLFTLGISNEMSYNFSVFLLILLMFYMFLMLLHIFYYVPFSTRPEHMFVLTKNRFFSFTQTLLENIRQGHVTTLSPLKRFSSSYSKLHLLSTVKQMQMWANGIDVNYFKGLEKEKLIAFTKAAERFAYLVELLYDKEIQMKDNPLGKKLSQSHTAPYFSDLLAVYAHGGNSDAVDDFWKDKHQIQKKVADHLFKIFEEVDFEVYEKKDIATLYENLSLRRHVWFSFFECQTIMQTLDFHLLKQSRF